VNASKWIELNQDSLRIGTAKAVVRLMSFAQITYIRWVGASDRYAMPRALHV